LSSNQQPATSNQQEQLDLATTSAGVERTEAQLEQRGASMCGKYQLVPADDDTIGNIHMMADKIVDSERVDDIRGITYYGDYPTSLGGWGGVQEGTLGVTFESGDYFEFPITVGDSNGGYVYRYSNEDMTLFLNLN
jgi:hypothetical protein